MKIEKVATIVKYNVEIDEDELTCLYELLKAKVNTGEVCSKTCFDIYDVIRPLREVPTSCSSTSKSYQQGPKGHQGQQGVFTLEYKHKYHL